MSFFLQQSNVFFDLFRKMQCDIEKISSLFSEFSTRFDAATFEDFITRAHIIENNADNTAHAIVDQLNISFITPFDREDIHFLAYEMDDIVDRIEDIIRNIHLYHFTEKVHPIDEFADCIARATTHLGVMLDHLEKMKNTRTLTTCKIAIHEIEDEADLLFENAISTLFKEETDPVKIIKTKDILEEMETVVDKYQALANLIENIIIKMS